MGKGGFTAGSLNSMAVNVREKKYNPAAPKAPLAHSRAQQKSQELDDSSSSSSSETSDSGSDSDSDIEAERKKWTAKLASKNKPAEAKVNGTKSAPAKSTPTAVASSAKKSTNAQNSSDSDSDSDSDSSSAGPKKAPSSGLVAKKKTADESESESDSDSESESEGQSNKKDAKRSTKGDVSSSEESDSDSDELSSSDDEDDTAAAGASKNKNDKRANSATGSKAIARVNSDAVAAESASEVARSLWLNNSDFMLRKASSDNPGKEVADFFSNVNLEGKQLWYFTAPASLPITVLKDMEIDLAKATAGGPLLKHEGDDYGLDLEPYATSTQIQLLIPSHGGDRYTTLNRGINSTVHLRRMAKFGPGGEVSATAPSEYTPQPKPVRQQPQGLKVRFTPIGVPNPKLPPKAAQEQPGSHKSSGPLRSTISKPSTSDSEADSDVEMTNASKVPLPASSSATNGTLKRKLPNEGEQPSSSAAKGAKSDEKKSTKRPKSTPSRLPSERKETPVQPPNLPRIAPVPTSTPSKPSTLKSKDKKDKKGGKDRSGKTPEGLEKPKQSPKRTPVPPPAYLGMAR
ncbi:DNA-directed RNA polymerase I subunit RPA34.5-domain-containing protein [Biscogniauxia marginata]|nr:DNA-directed RNA polymerase I subunit RPA34.5-domain-containing protein [Biscogniauxia marginata]